MVNQILLHISNTPLELVEYCQKNELDRFTFALDSYIWMYEKAKEDKTFRTDIPKDVFMRATVHTMMAACA